MKIIIFIVRYFILVLVMFFINQSMAEEMTKYGYQKSKNSTSVSCTDDKMIFNKISDALKYFNDKNIDKFLDAITKIDCLQRKFYSKKAGSGIIKNSHYIGFHNDRNEVESTNKRWIGQSSAIVEIAIIDKMGNVIFNDATMNYTQQTLVLFCIDKVYIFDYHDEIFGYYERGEGEKPVGCDKAQCNPSNSPP